MNNWFNFKKLSSKIAFIVGATVIIVGGTIAAYMEVRIISEVNLQSELYIKNELYTAAERSNVTFLAAAGMVAGIKNFAESTLDISAYRSDAEGYFEGSIRPSMSKYIVDVVKRNDFIEAAYFAADPNLAGRPYVCEVFYKMDGGAIVPVQAQPYEKYIDSDSGDMEWFYGAFVSGKPFWTGIYLLGDKLMVSYAEPVIIDSVIVGVVGVDMSMENIADILRGITLYDTGFVFMGDNGNEFIEINDIVKGLSAAKKSELGLIESDLFEITLNGVEYSAAKTKLVNGYPLYLLAPVSEVTSGITASLIKFVVIFITAFIIVVIISYFIGKAISAPLVVLAGFMKKAGTTGDVILSDKDTEIIDNLSHMRDEIGQCIGATAIFMKQVANVADDLVSVAGGDLTTEIELLSEADVMGKALMLMVCSLNEIFGEIGASSGQVNTGSKQIASAAQTLAHGTTEQAATVEQLSASTSEIAEKTKANSEMAASTASMAETIRHNAEKGSAQMDEMMKAVNEINQASHSIGKVIKVIDDIAFQTNILALNAAVEAARAGEHGKGFAVVSDEVRNLAAKSAEAAKDTGSLIQNSIEKAELGSKIANDTSASLAEIVSGINESALLISNIAMSSSEQTTSITQIHDGINQVAHVVQQDSATAEECAAASEELSGQSELLKQLVSRFKLKNTYDEQGLDA